uniref:Endonuclease-reverse transcriptase n=1 Tax=Cacopsylla melanoneura TaxID=428564 RepID=A0A8D9F9E7_9HEMI
MTLYNTIIKPVLLYGAETWSITKKGEHQLQVFGNKVYRKIFGGYFEQSTQTWKRRHNVDIHGLAKQPNIVATMNANRLRWMGHLMRVDRNRAAWSIYTSTPQGRRLPGRPRSCWRNEMMRLCQKWRLDDWEESTQDRVQ